MESLILAALFLLSFVAGRAEAVCCSNVKKLCIVNAITCTPNCGDLISYCDLSVSRCLDDTWGGCVTLVTAYKTTIAGLVNPTATVTSLSGTTTQTSTTSVVWQTSTIRSSSKYTTTKTVTSVTTQTVTTAGDTVTQRPVVVAREYGGVEDVAAAQGVGHIVYKRASTPTTTIVVTQTDSTFCAHTNHPLCTTTVFSPQVNLVAAYVTSVTTTIIGESAVATDTTTSLSTSTVTVTGAGKTVAGAPAATASLSPTAVTVTAAAPAATAAPSPTDSAPAQASNVPVSAASSPPAQASNAPVSAATSPQATSAAPAAGTSPATPVTGSATPATGSAAPATTSARTGSGKSAYSGVFSSLLMLPLQLLASVWL